MGVYIGVDDYSAMQGPCPSGFHIPLKSEMDTLITAGISLGAWTGGNGNGVKTYLKMPFAGMRAWNSGNSIYYQGAMGNYRASNGSGVYGNGWTISSSYNDAGGGYNPYGESIRPFKDEPVIPDSSWTKTYSGTGDAGIYHNSTLGLISISSDGQTWITISDKNLGATTVYNDGDTLSQNNCGYYYQFGNNYGFPRTGTITTSAPPVDASSYGPGNYYSSSTFVNGNSSYNSWNSPVNTNLRGGETGILPYSPLKNAYIGEVWTPGENTIAYYQFDGNLNDSSGNGYDLSLYSGSITYGKETGGGKYAYFNTNTWTNNYTGFRSFNSDHFTAMWYWQPKQIFSSGYSIVMWLITSGGTDIETTRRSITTGGGITLSAVNNTWYHLAQVRDGTTEKLYVNGVLYGTGTRTASGTTGTKFRLNNADNTNSSSNANDNYLGEMILEDRTWTAQEISHYYDITKSNYGL